MRPNHPLRSVPLVGSLVTALGWTVLLLATGHGPARADTPRTPFPHHAPTRPTVALDDSARVRRWREDVDSVVQRVLATHPRPFARGSHAGFDSAARAIRSRVPVTPDPVLAVETMRMVALLEDGHTMVIGTLPPLGFTSVLPLWLRPCEDGLVVGAAGPAHAAWVGARVTRIGVLGADEALERVLGMTSGDNRYSRLDRAPLFLMMPAALHALGITPDPEVVTLELARAGGRAERVTLSGGPPPDGFPQTFLETEPAFPSGWTSARRVTPETLPRCDRRPDEAWWFETLPGGRVVYLRLRRIETFSGRQTYLEFFRDLFTTLDRQRPDALVIDLRHDHGGNNNVVDPLIRGLVERPWLNRDGGLFALVDRGTFSAAMNTAVFLQDQTRVRFVGEPTGARPNHYGDAPERDTPNLGMMLQVSTLPWYSRDPSDDRPWIAPHLALPSTFARWSAPGDAVLDATLGLIANGTLQRRLLEAARRGGAPGVLEAHAAWERAHPNPWRTGVGDDLANLTTRLIDSGGFEDARAVTEAWTRLAPDSPRAWARRGEASALAGDRATARTHLLRALELVPGNSLLTMMLERLDTGR